MINSISSQNLTKNCTTPKRSSQSVNFAGSSKFSESMMRGVHGFFEKADTNAALFNAGLSLIIGDFLRPPALMAVPGTKKDDKKYAVAKSIAGSTMRFFVALILFFPMEKGLKKLGKVAKPGIKNEFPFEVGKRNANGFSKFDAFNYFTNRGAELIIAPFQAILFTKMLPVIVDKAFPKKKNPQMKGSAFVEAKSIDNDVFSNFLGGNKK